MPTRWGEGRSGTARSRAGRLAVCGRDDRLEDDAVTHLGLGEPDRTGRQAEHTDRLLHLRTRAALPHVGQRRDDLLIGIQKYEIERPVHPGGVDPIARLEPHPVAGKNLVDDARFLLLRAIQDHQPRRQQRPSGLVQRQDRSANSHC
jgi:hypothetical protein